jgi:hypothetical protein
MATVAFNQWVAAVFDHPLSRPERYWSKDFDWGLKCLPMDIKENALAGCVALITASAVAKESSSVGTSQL